MCNEPESVTIVHRISKSKLSDISMLTYMYMYRKVGENTFMSHSTMVLSSYNMWEIIEL